MQHGRYEKQQQGGGVRENLTRTDACVVSKKIHFLDNVFNLTTVSDSFSVSFLGEVDSTYIGLPVCMFQLLPYL